MAIGIGAIASGVAEIGGNIINGILSIFGMGGAQDKKYPDNIGGAAILNFTNQPDFKDGAWRESRGYAFQVHRVRPGESKTLPATGWKEFRLQINPQELTQDEIFAIEVTPTFRGVVVEHHGQILKDIMISGTTGKTPKSREGGSVKGTGRPILASGHSGFEEFHELRSYIRAYVEQKRIDDRNEGELRLVFRNFKDSEFLFVEPQKFTMKRSSQRATLYDYVIQLKAIGVADAPDKAKGDNFGLLGDIFDVLETATDAINTATATIQASIGLLRRAEQNIENKILGPLIAINNAALAIKGGANSLFGEHGVTRRSVEKLKVEIERVENNMGDLLGRDMGPFNLLTGRVPTLSGVSGRQSTASELKALNGLQKAKRGLTMLLSEDELFTADSSRRNEGVESIFGGKITIPRANSARAVTIDGQDNIQSLAARELGDPDRFREIVLLNNLKPPYIDVLGGAGILKPGDKVLLPKQSQQESTGVKKNKEFNITKLLNETEKNLGVDIRLNKNNDIAVANTNDLDLIAGVENLSQAVLVRLNLEPGSLKRHLGIGTGLAIGSKATSDRLTEIRNNIVSSFGSDLRISNIPFIEVRQEGNATIINLILKIKNLDQPIPLPITVTGAA